jgi:hypothetical protein
MSTGTLHRVILSYPTVVNLTDTTDATAPRSWIQLARTGAFVSKRYGKFTIEKTDLSQMLSNFTTITPKAPTLLPVDWDHLSMQDPKQPGDGAAAGWMKNLELRDSGDTLWAEVEWTPKAAEAIKNREYQFVSPSFVQNHTHKDGQKIGTTLLAAAITNHPFLEGMQALTLRTPAIAGVHLSVALRDLVASEDGNVSLSAAIGQRVTIGSQHARAPQHVGVVFEIIRVDGMGGDDESRVWLKNAISGEEIGWYPASELEPARAANANPIPLDRQQQEGTTMHANNADDELIQLSNTIARERGISLRDATLEASRRRPDLVDQRRADIGVETTTADHAAAEARPIINLNDGESFFALCQRVSAERQIHLSQAFRVVSAAHPNLAEAYARGDSL